MEATITNLGTTSPDDDVFLCGPKLELKAGEAKVWSNLTVADLDADIQLKQLQLDGKVSVALGQEATDLAVATQGSFAPHILPRFTVATLPTGANAVNGMVAYATNGRSGAEGAAAGTGVMVLYTNAQWRRLEDMAVVAA